GKNLYMAENNPVMIRKETTEFTMCKINSGAGRTEADQAPRAAIHALTAKETTRRNPMASTKENENRRSLMKLESFLSPLSSGVGTSQMVFKASRNSISTPEAPKKRVSTPKAVARMP